MHASYTLHRAFLFLWRWTVELDGRPVKSGIAVSKGGGRWAARSVIRGLRARPREAEIERGPEPAPPVAARRRRSNNGLAKGLDARPGLRAD